MRKTVSKVGDAILMSHKKKKNKLKSNVLLQNPK